MLRSKPVLEEPTPKRFKSTTSNASVVDGASSTQDDTPITPSADPFSTDGGHVHSPFILTQVDDSSVPSDVAVDSSVQDGSAKVPTPEAPNEPTSTVPTPLDVATPIPTAPSNPAVEPISADAHLSTNVPNPIDVLNPAGEPSVSAKATPGDSIPSGSTPSVSPSSTWTRKKTAAQKRASVPVTEMDDQDLLKFDSESEPEEDPPMVWSVVTGWRLISTPVGDYNALHKIDGFIKHFSYLREILHLVDKQDLIALYGYVVAHYRHHTATGVGLILWGDLKVLMDSIVGGTTVYVWKPQDNWQVRSWRLYTPSNVHVVDTMDGRVMYMVEMLHILFLSS